MSDSQMSSESQSTVAPGQAEQLNELSRKNPTRPGWIAILVALAFVGGLGFFVTNF